MDIFGMKHRKRIRELEKEVEISNHLRDTWKFLCNNWGEHVMKLNEEIAELKQAKESNGHDE